MGALKERALSRLKALRERYTLVDHGIRAVGHYGNRNGNAQAGAVTFFAFLSFFPILALAFFVVGYVSTVFPGVRGEVRQALEQILPGVVGNDDGQIPLKTFEEYAGRVGLIGLAGVLYSGLGWVSGMRSALEVMFRLPRTEQPNFVQGMGRDLRALVVLGVVLLLSISLTGAISWFSQVILGWVGLADSWLATVALWFIAHGLATLATALLFVAMFGLLAKPHVANRALWQGAFVGAVGFEVLKSVASFLISQTKDQPAFQAFGVALILVVWINYFSRLVMLSAAWAYTAPAAEELRELEREPLVSPEEGDLVTPAPASVVAEANKDSPHSARRREQLVGRVAGLTSRFRRSQG
ncbi:MAG TPA: YihY/virulence factor BrkB family protein [Nocardioidaceae bacterium]|nr:YihY/virulence factor BrkB family protein [Nocardioidaceae bacterium]